MAKQGEATAAQEAKQLIPTLTFGWPSKGVGMLSSQEPVWSIKPQLVGSALLTEEVWREDLAEGDWGAAEEAATRLNRLALANEDLRGALSRCYDLLGSLFELTRELGGAGDGGAQRVALLRRYARMVEARALYLDDGALLTAVPGSGDKLLDAASAAALRAAIASRIETTRKQRATVSLERSGLGARLGESHLMLGALAENEREPCVVVAIRDPEDPPFDSTDRLASETALTYGGHILRAIDCARRLQTTSLEAVRALALAVEARDPYTHGHSKRVARLARQLGSALGLPADELQALEWSGLLHDVGKLGVPESILQKRGELTTEEFEVVRQHPRIGYEVLAPVTGLASLLAAVRSHHENYDGSGYPDGLAGEAIPRHARILRVVDIFDALTSRRSYRDDWNVEDALERLEADAGKVTDAEITRVFVAAVRGSAKEW